MRILYIHNDYAKPSGEETAAEAIVALLKEHGHEVEWHRRSSAEIAGSAWRQIKSLFTGLVNPCEAKAVTKHIHEFKPDLVQVQNIYPLLSPSIFPAIFSRGQSLPSDRRSWLHWLKFVRGDSEAGILRVGWGCPLRRSQPICHTPRGCTRARCARPAHCARMRSARDRNFP